MFEWPIEGPQWTPSRCALTARPALIRPSIVDSIRGFQCPIFPKSRAWPIPGLSPVSARSDPTNFEPCKCLFLVFLVAVLLWSPVDRLSAFPFNLGSIDVVACPLTFVILSAFFFPPSVGVQRSSAVHFILWVFLSTFPSPLLRCQSSLLYSSSVRPSPASPGTHTPLCPLLPEDSRWFCTVSAIILIISSYAIHPSTDYT